MSQEEVMHHGEHLLLGAVLLAVGSWIHGFWTGRKR